MAYQDDKQTQGPEQDEKQRPEEELVREQSPFGFLPNSLMMAMPVKSPPGTPNSVMREMMDDAEEKAKGFSVGIPSGIPNSKNDPIDSRTHTRSSDIYFGRDNYTPTVAAHELTHTLQHSVIPNRVSKSVPAEIVQRGLFSKIKRLLGRNKDDEEPSNDDLINDDDPIINDELNDDTKELAGEESDLDDGPEGQEEKMEEDLGGRKKSKLRRFLRMRQLTADDFDEWVDKYQQRKRLGKYAADGGEEDEVEKPINNALKAAVDESGPASGVTEPKKTESLDPDSVISSSGAGSIVPDASAAATTTTTTTNKDPASPSPRPMSASANNRIFPAPPPLPVIPKLKDDENDRGNRVYGYHAGSSGWGPAKKWTVDAPGFLRNVDTSVNSIAKMSAVDVDTNGGDGLSSGWKYEALPGMGLVADSLGFFGGAAGVITGGHDVYKNVKNIKAGASSADAVGSVLDTTAAASSYLSSSVGIVEKAATLAAGSSVSAGALVPGLNIVTGAATALNGAMQTARGARSLSKINDQIDNLQNLRIPRTDEHGPSTEREKKLSEAKEEMGKIFGHTKRVQQINITNGVFKTASGLLNAGTGIATVATGPLAPMVGGALALTSAALNAFRFALNKGLKHKLRKDTIASDGEFNWKTEMELVRNIVLERNAKRHLVRHLGIRDKEVREIILRGRGYKGVTRHAAFQEIKLKRARYLLKWARIKEAPRVQWGPEYQMADMADRVIEAMGVHKRDGRYAEGAEGLLAEKLG